MAESLPQKLARGANALLRPLGLQILRHERAFDMDGLLARSASRGPAIATWIDVGASDGSWSLRARRHFPNARFVLFEPLEERQAALRALAQKCGFHIVAAAAGEKAGTIEFSIDPELDGSGVAGSNAGPTRRVPVVSIAEAITQRSSSPPYGIKLDTHGFEVPILEGAGAILDRAELLIVEAYNFELTDKCLRFHELCAWLEARGFRCCDVADVMRRPADGALWQMDLAFARANHSVFTRESYR